MRLKRIKIFGFKTFADRTDLELRDDILAVVGPNGCGKSNLVDAILWGLGESSARSLRAGTNQDVIFSGSAGRKPLGYAEVTLIFDNEDGALGVDASEVAITRRLTRGGETEVSINRRACRLKDVHELLADSGLGRSGYAIVGQREIDAALAASPEERRAWVDEAAGVQRYRAHRQDAMRRLAATEGHLARLSDLIAEIEDQREPLREEAELAQRYKEAMGALRSLESGLMIQDVARAVNEVVEYAASAAQTMARARELEAEATLQEQASLEARARLAGIEADIENARTRREKLREEAAEAEASLRVCRERLENLATFEAGLVEEEEASEARIAEARAEAERLCEQLVHLEAEAESLRAELAEVDGEAAADNERLDVIERELIEARRAAEEAVTRRARDTERQKRRQLVAREIAGAEEALPELEAGIAEAQASFDQIEERFKAGEEQRRLCEAEIERLLAEEAEAQRTARKLASEAEVAESRRRAIEGTIQAQEGLAEGARAVIEAAQAGELEGSYTPVLQAIAVDARHARAIEIALGASTNDLIVPDEAHARRAIEHLKRHRLGRATFQPIPLMRPHTDPPELRRLIQEPGIVGLANELVTCTGVNQPVIDSLLGRILIVEDLPTALRLAKTSGWRRLVTLDGEVVHAAGSVTGGQAARSGSGLLQRKAELEQLGQQVEKARKLVGQATQAAALCEAQVRSERERLVSLSKTRREEQTEWQEARDWLARLTHEREAAQRSLAKLRAELDEPVLTPETEANMPDVAEIERRRDELLRSLAERSGGASQLAERLREAEHRLADGKRRRAEADRRYEVAVEHDQRRLTRRESMEAERSRALSDAEKHEHRLAELSGGLLGLDAEIEGHQARRTATQAEVSELAEKAKATHAAAMATAQQANTFEVARARADARRAASAQRLLEEYGLDENEAVRQAPEVTLPEDAPVVVARLRREIKEMGEVNLGAIEAFRKLTERYETLAAQVSDVEGGKQEIERAIEELDRMTKDRFRDTLEQLDVAFRNRFEKLFGGGSGRLRLTDPTNLLESGLDLEVTIPGKKTQRLELLSGGERALCACAFLFALLMIKPSPLVVLDELDAPLDGRNVERYADLLKDMARASQFIVVTHNPVTIAASPTWWGVTMPEPGVSRVVPHTQTPSHALIETLQPTSA